MRGLKIHLLRLARAMGLFAITRWVTRYNPKILCYHAFQLRDEANRLGFRVLPLDQVVTNLYAKKTRTHSLAITIDDGFHSFSTEALPTLRPHGYAATVYVTTYYVEKGGPVFRLMVQYMMWLGSRGVRTPVQLPVVEGLVALSDRIARDDAINRIVDYGENHCDEPRRHQLCIALGDALGLAYEELAATHVMELMRPEQLAELANAGIDVGLHTHRHRFPVDNREAARQEITENRAALQRIVGNAVQHFCYPSGKFDPVLYSGLGSTN